MQGLFYGDGGDEGAVGDGEEGAEGDPEHEAYPGGVAQGAKEWTEAPARGRALKDDEDEGGEPGDQERGEYEGDDEPKEGRVDEGVVELP